ncbi:unnamed protein product, partial [Closterium sp. Yama58-4]
RQQKGSPARAHAQQSQLRPQQQQQQQQSTARSSASRNSEKLLHQTSWSPEPRSVRQSAADASLARPGSVPAVTNGVKSLPAGTEEEE